jgi:hypothetical protein
MQRSSIIVLQAKDNMTLTREILQNGREEGHRIPNAMWKDDRNEFSLGLIFPTFTTPCNRSLYSYILINPSKEFEWSLR